VIGKATAITIAAKIKLRMFIGLLWQREGP
jgi:hypothetical protein